MARASVRSIRRGALAMALLAAACMNCGGTTDPRSEGPSGRATSRILTILGAASLKSVLDQAKAAYEAADPGTTLATSTDSSAALEAQIEQGASADVFLSADTTNPRKLVAAGLAEGEPIVFAANELTIVAPADNPAGIASWRDLANDGLRIVAAGAAVPITEYANRLVANLAAEPEAPMRFADAYAENIVSREENVKALIAKIELGEGDAGIVYVTDAKASTRVQTIAVPDDANVPASYAGVVLKASHDTQEAESFLAWFAGPGGQAILAEHGFLPPRG